MVTMSNKCFRKMKEGEILNASGKYAEALALFLEMEKSCTTVDAKKAAQVGKATALNGLARYEEALTAADLALKYSKNTSIGGYFQRAIANEALHRSAEAQNDLHRIIDLTERNENVRERATLFAKMADLQWKQGNRTEAENNLRRAILLDPENTDFLLQRGNIRVALRQYEEALGDFDKALELGRDDLEIYLLRTNTRFKQLEQKYQSRDASRLHQKMTAQEKKQLCEDIAKAREKGAKDPQLDLLALTVCE